MNYELKFPLDKSSFIAAWNQCAGVQSVSEHDFVVVLANLIDAAYQLGYNDGKAVA